MASINGIRAVACLLLALAPAAGIALTAERAEACGVCHGDKIGAVYDHATVTKAIAERKKVAFADVEGGFMNQGEAGIAFMRNAVNAEDGVVGKHTKVSSSPTAVAFVFDPKKGAADAFLDRINGRLSGKKWKLVLIKVLGPPEP